MVRGSDFWRLQTMAFRALVALLLLSAPTAADEFEISAPTTIANLAMPCWTDAQLSKAMTIAKFEIVVRGLLTAKTSSDQPLVVVWVNKNKGNGAITLSHPNRDECLAAIIEDAE
jgi:hypothetical protein